MNQPSLDTLVQEIEATPVEHWAELLSQLRQFREQVALKPMSQDNILQFIQQIRDRQTTFLTTEQIDQQMQEERAAWDK
jgi:hypothetical protein